MGSSLTLRNELSKKTYVLTKQETIGKRRSSGELQGKGTQENCSAAWLAVSGFMVMGLVSGWSLANHSYQSLSWWCTHRSAKMDASERDSGTWTDSQCLLLAFPGLFRLMVALVAY